VKNKLSKTIFGALSLRGQKFYWKQAQRGNSTQFRVFLHQLHKAYPEKTLVLILDNGSIHRSKKIKRFLTKHRWIKLFFLPPYSPEYNPIERFWGWLKRKIYGCKSFKCMDEMVTSLRKLVWHYHENHLINKIQFNFKPYVHLL